MSEQATPAMPRPASTFLEGATALIERGWYVFPCRLDKSPHTPHGYKDATRDPDTLRIWSMDHPGAQPAIACEQSGLVVLDVDDVDAFNAYLQRHSLTPPATLSVTTPSGGRHYYYRAVSGQEYKATLCQGVDIKHRGYVLAPPATAHSERSGITGPYVWDNLGTAVSPAPTWLQKEPDKTMRTGAADRPGPVSCAEVRELLTYLDPDMEYNDWLAVLMHVHDATDGSGDGLRIADAWSAEGSKYVPRDVEGRWPGFPHGDGSGMRKLAAKAREQGADLGEIGRRHRSAPTPMSATPQAEEFDFAKLDLTHVVPFRGNELEEWIRMLEASSPHGAHEGSWEAAADEGACLVAPTAPIPPHVLTRVETLKASLILGSEAKAITDSDYVVKGWLGAGASSLMIGAANEGKSFLALGIANHVAKGLEWNGCRVKGGSAFYFAAEGGRMFQNRVVALAGGASDRLVVLPEAVDLHSDDVDVSAIVHLINSFEPRVGKPALVVFDTLARVIAGGDENTGPDMARILRRVDHVRSETGAHVMLVHHTGKDAERGARGHSSLRCGIDTEIEVKRSGDEKYIQATKQRDMESGSKIGFRLVPVEIGVDEDGDPGTSCYAEFYEISAGKAKSPPAGKVQKDVLRRLRTFVGDHGRDVEIGDPPRRVQAVDREQFVEHTIADSTKTDRKGQRRSVTEALQGLERGSFVAGHDNWLWLETGTDGTI